MATGAWGIMAALAGLLASTVPAAAQPADANPLAKIGMPGRYR